MASALRSGEFALRRAKLEIGQSTPFLKWAGGKRWLVNKYAHLFPERFSRYFEPFLGSAAVFFALKPSRAFLSDSNRQLIELYVAIKSNWQTVEQHLEAHSRLHSKEYYYHIRQARFRSAYQRAAQLLYLNRTCWNGLYRVNLSGTFNVPKGTKSRVLLATDDFEDTSDTLRSAELRSEDFEIAIDRSASGDFIFVDPPYTVQHNANNFVKYNEKIFSWDDQIRLRNGLRRAKSRGALIMMTNAYHDSVRDLYSGLGQEWVVSRQSVIAASSGNRGVCQELLITTW
jgi:DNA adenine methylase